MKGHGSLHTITWILVIIGGLNWLLLGLFNWDIGMIFGGMSSVISKIIYILVGLAAVYELTMHKKLCKECEKMGSSMPSSPANM